MSDNPAPTSPANPPPGSPPWNENLKLVVSLSLVALSAGFAITFRSIIGPLLLAFILTYLLHPLATWLHRRTRLSWTLASNLVFLLLLALLISLSTVAGVAVVQQVQSLLAVLNNLLNNPPTIASLNELLSQSVQIGMFEFQLSDYVDINAIGTQLVSLAQTLIGQAGALLSSFAAGAASTLGWVLFVLLITYFVLVDADKFPNLLAEYESTSYGADWRRLGQEIGRIWNAFLRGQLLIVILVILTYSLVFSILGVRYAVGLALLAGVARFVPYIGPLTTNVVTFLVAFFQPNIPFGMEAPYYAVLVVVIALVVDQVYDNVVSPRIMGESLGVHPAAVLISAIIAANLIGFIGLLLAAPVLASVSLALRYLLRKLLDLDPWPPPSEQEKAAQQTQRRWAPERWGRRLQAWLKLQWERRRKK